MKVIVDTSVWSLALRRDVPSCDPFVDELIELIREVRVQLMGSVRQELLSGIKSSRQFDVLKLKLAAFDDLHLKSQDYELAATYFNAARSKGIQGSNTDFLICAASTRRNLSILTMDKDFSNFKSVIPVFLHKPRT